jgi:hemerythrin-like domain-containing protein
MKTPTATLRDEHVLILQALGVLEAAATRDERGLAIPQGWWPRLIAWLRTFADGNHHAKEERALFPALVTAGVPAEGGPIAVMMEEHVEGRALLQIMAGGEASSRRAAARRYIDLLRAHIDKENSILFPLADEVLDAAALSALGRQFEAVATEIGRQASLDDAAAVLQELAAALGSPAEVSGAR